jgi:hypothetical protein
MPDQTRGVATSAPGEAVAAGPAPATPAREDEHAVDDLRELADVTAVEASRYLQTVTEVAAGANPDAAIPLLLLAVSELIAAGARLGAITDVVPDERFEPDDGPDPDAEPLHTGLANVLEGIDEYTYVPDVLVSTSLSPGTLSGDLATIAQALSQGLVHFRAGHKVEALWWWQFSYVSFWGDAAASALRALLSVLAHLRLDVDDEIAADAEFDALHP